MNTDKMLDGKSRIQQQANRVIPVGRFDLSEFPRLFFQVNMQFQTAPVCFGDVTLHLIPWHGPQRMHTRLHGLASSQHALQLIEPFPVPMNPPSFKSPLGVREIHPRTALFISRRQQNQLDPGVVGGLDDGFIQREIRVTQDLMPEVMELTHRSDPRLQHLPITAMRQLVRQIRVHPFHQAVHGLPPRPKVGHTGWETFSRTSQADLKSVGMGAGESRKHWEQYLRNERPPRRGAGGVK